MAPEYIDVLSSKYYTPSIDPAQGIWEYAGYARDRSSYLSS